MEGRIYGSANEGVNKSATPCVTSPARRCIPAGAALA